MRHNRVEPTGLLTSFALLIASAVLLSGCGWRSRDLQPGVYRAVLDIPGGELPFGLEIAKEDSDFLLTLLNGEERVRVSEVTVEDGRLAVVLPGPGNRLSARISGDVLKGEVILQGSDGETRALPFTAEHGVAWRFFEEPLSDNADVSGRWSVTFTDDSGESTSAVAEFEQSFGIVTGAVPMTGSDRRLLAGEIRDEELYLSRFDGTQALLYRATVDERGDLVGEYWSSDSGHGKFVARRS